MNKKNHPRKLSKNLKFDDLNFEEGVEYEYYPNGVFLFNITKLIEYIGSNKDEFEIAEIRVKDYQSHDNGKSLNPEYVAAADLSRPIILAEIAPDRLLHEYPDISPDYYSRGYNIIDGHHRLAKAHQMGIETLRAYVVRMEKHIPFMIEGMKSMLNIGIVSFCKNCPTNRTVLFFYLDIERMFD